MFLVFTGDNRGEANHVYCRDDRFQSDASSTAGERTVTDRIISQRQPPAKGGSTSITAPSSSTIDSLAARPTGSAFTRKDDRAMTVARRVPAPGGPPPAWGASRGVPASTASPAVPAASFAAAQYLMVTLAMSVI